MKTKQKKIDNNDKKILSIIARDARVPLKDVAKVCNMSRAAVHQRVLRMIEGGVITGSRYDVSPQCVGYSTCTYVGISLDRGSRYQSVVDQLNKIPEIVECHFTGRTPCSSNCTRATTRTSWCCSTTRYRK